MVNSMCKSTFEQRVGNMTYSLTRAIFHSLSVPRFRGLEQSKDALVAQQVDVTSKFTHAAKRKR